MSEHYFSKNPKVEYREIEIEETLRGENFKFITAPGVFSIKEIDEGTKLLIDYSRVYGKVLDLGCGYGAIGIAIAKTSNSDVTCSDINNRSLKFTEITAKLNKVKLQVIESDGFSNIKENFDTIVSNPPFHAGKETVMKLIFESFEHLNDKGTLQIVAKHNKGGKSFRDYMEKIFGNVEDIVKQNGFRVYKSIKSL